MRVETNLSMMFREEEKDSRAKKKNFFSNILLAIKVLTNKVLFIKAKLGHLYVFNYSNYLLRSSIILFS